MRNRDFTWDTGMQWFRRSILVFCIPSSDFFKNRTEVIPDETPRREERKFDFLINPSRIGITLS